jgi:hypothetical protein
MIESMALDPECRTVHLIELMGLGTFIVIIALVNFQFAPNDGRPLTFLVQYLSPVAGSMLILLGMMTILLRKKWVEGAFWMGVGYLIAGVGNAAIFGWRSTPMFIVIGLVFLWTADLVSLVQYRYEAPAG